MTETEHPLDGHKGVTARGQNPAADSSADVVIIGSGVVGAAIAHKLATQGHSVVILEAGLRLSRREVVERFRDLAFFNHANGDFNAPYRQAPGAPAPLYFPPNHYLGLSGPDGDAFKQGFLKTVGGTTWHWAASCWRHLPVDFTMRSTYGVGLDWPISYQDLEPYYCAAEALMGVSGPQDPALQSPSERSRPYPRPMIPWGHGDRMIAEKVDPLGFRSVPIPQGRSLEPYEDRPACCGNNNCQPICPIGATYNGLTHVVRAEEAGAKLYTQAVAYKFDTDETNRITAVHWLDAQGTSHRVTGKAFVVAGNGIESPRLLLMARNARNPEGIANSSGMVGRNMMDHSGLHASFLSAEPLWIGRGTAQTSCMVGTRDGPFRSQYSATKIIINNLSRVPTATRDALKTGLVGKALADEVRRRAICAVDLSISLEPLPDPKNRLTLSTTRKDPLGLPCPDIYYDVGDYVRRGAEVVTRQCHTIAAAFDATEVNVSTQFNANNHIMGACIMGADPKTSVTDGNCRAHDHPNLWIPGGSAMVTASVVNTTLTMVALALRSADAIQHDFKAGRLTA